VESDRVLANLAASENVSILYEDRNGQLGEGRTCVGIISEVGGTVPTMKVKEKNPPFPAGFSSPYRVRLIFGVTCGAPWLN